jgi:hypothetical protein
VVPQWEVLPWLKHGFSTRLGGVSEHSQASLNLGGHVGDDPVKVEENRRRWAKALAMEGAESVYMQQVHSNRVSIATAGGSFVATDGVVTNTPGLVLHVLVADCLPVLLLDPVTRVVGAVHAGWRGTVDSIVVEAVRVMVQEYGAKVRDIQAAIGPGIGGCCYRVDEPVLQKVRELSVEWAMAMRESGTSGEKYLDLAVLNRLLLLRAGLDAKHITDSGLCTMADAGHFFSYRRDHGETGRQAGSIALIP